MTRAHVRVFLAALLCFGGLAWRASSQASRADAARWGALGLGRPVTSLQLDGRGECAVSAVKVTKQARAFWALDRPFDESPLRREISPRGAVWSDALERVFSRGAETSNLATRRDVFGVLALAGAVEGRMSPRCASSVATQVVLGRFALLGVSVSFSHLRLRHFFEKTFSPSALDPVSLLETLEELERVMPGSTHVVLTLESDFGDVLPSFATIASVVARCGFGERAACLDAARRFRDALSEETGVADLLLQWKSAEGLPSPLNPLVFEAQGSEEALSARLRSRRAFTHLTSLVEGLRSARGALSDFEIALAEEGWRQGQGVLSRAVGTPTEEATTEQELRVQRESALGLLRKAKAFEACQALETGAWRMVETLLAPSVAADCKGVARNALVLTRLRIENASDVSRTALPLLETRTHVVLGPNAARDDAVLSLLLDLPALQSVETQAGHDSLLLDVLGRSGVRVTSPQDHDGSTRTGLHGGAR